MAKTINYTFSPKKLSGNKATSFGVSQKYFSTHLATFIKHICMLWRLNTNLDCSQSDVSIRTVALHFTVCYSHLEQDTSSSAHQKGLCGRFKFVRILFFFYIYTKWEKYVCVHWNIFLQRQSFIYKSLNAFHCSEPTNLFFCRVVHCPQQEICNPLTMGCKINHKGSKKI